VTIGTAPQWVLAALLASGVVTAACTPDAVRAQDVNPQALALREFGERARAYAALRTRLAAELPPESREATPDQIAHHQQQLAAAVRRARRDARQGDIFTPPVVPQFRTIIRRDLQSRDIRDALAVMQDVPLTLTLHVNAPWPPDVPRPIMPPRLLANLYPLPEGLEYRFIDRHLVLLDSEANLVADYILHVVPSVVRRRR
jgi:hypothetical protein